MLASTNRRVASALLRMAGADETLTRCASILPSLPSLSSLCFSSVPGSSKDCPDIDRRIRITPIERRQNVLSSARWPDQRATVMMAPHTLLQRVGPSLIMATRSSSTQAAFDAMLLDEARRRRPQSVTGSTGNYGGRKRRAVTSHIAQRRSPSVVSLAIAEALDLYGAAADPAITNLYTATFIDDEFDHAIHLVKKVEYTIDPSQARNLLTPECYLISEMFVFSDGVVVFWGIDVATRAAILRDLERHATGPYDSATAHSELDSIPFTIDGEGKSRIAGDCFQLESAKHADACHIRHGSVLERFAFSHAFAASVKLGVWETLLNGHAELLAETTKELKRGRIPWNRKEALRKSGEFADLRHSINLNCSLLDRDIYWERQELEAFYVKTLRHLAVEMRQRLLNNRLDYCEGMVRMVDGMLQVRHSAFLEWLIIILIVIEVFFDIYHYVHSRNPMEVIVVPSALKENKEGAEKTE